MICSLGNHSMQAEPMAMVHGGDVERKLHITSHCLTCINKQFGKDSSLGNISGKELMYSIFNYLYSDQPESYW